MTSRRGVSLVIKAKDEASRAFESASKAFGDLVALNAKAGSSADTTGAAFAEMARGLLTLDKAAATITGKFDASTNALARQAAAIGEQQSRLGALRGQMEAASKAATNLAIAIRESDRSGADTSPLRAKLEAVQASYRELAAEVQRADRNLATARSGYAAADSAVGALGAQVRQLGTAQAFAKAESDNLTRSLEQQARAAERTRAVGTAIARSTDSTGGKSAEESASAFQAAGLTSFERELEAEAAAIARLRAEINPLAAAQARLARETERLVQWQRQGKITADEGRQSLALLRAEADRTARTIAKPGTSAPFGLRAHELQNLSFQVNDLFTQVASGTSILQAAAQQGGQIVQIFPRVGSAIFGAFKSAPVLAFAAALGTVLAGLARAADEAERLRTFSGLLAANADGAQFQAQGLADAAKALDLYGLSAEEAVKVVRTFVREGLNQELFESFGESAKNLADVLGIDVVDAARQVAEAFGGGFEAIKKLDDATGFLTDSQRELIRQLFEEGRASEARTQALAIFTGKMEDAARNMRGPWKDATRELDRAWLDLLDTLADTGLIETSFKALGDLARGLIITLKTLRNADDVGDLTARIADGVDRVNELGKQQAANGGRSVDLNRRIDAERKALAVLRARRDALIATTDASKREADTVVQGSARQAKATRDLKRANEELRGAREGASAAERLAAAESKASREAELEVADVAFKFADAAEKQERIRLRVTQARAAEEKKITAEAKAQSRESERARKEAEKAAKFTQFQDPVAGKVTSGFGPRQSPGGVGSTFHRGIDFAVPVGTAVKSPALGVVEVVGFSKELGKYIVVNHGKGVKSTFGHLSDTSTVAAGDAVRAGDTIARSGNTGSATTGAHLHFQVTVNGKAVDPRKNGGKFQIDGGDAAEGVAGDLQDGDDFRLKQQDEFNRRLGDENERRQANIAAAQTELGLDGEALIAARRAEAIADAIAAKREEVDRINADLDRKGLARIAFTDQQREAVERLTAAEFDLAHARDVAQARRTAAGRKVEDISAERDAIRQQIDLLRSQGQAGGADALEPKLAAINAQLRQAIDSLIAFYKGLTATDLALEGLSPEGVAAIVTQLQNAKFEAQDVGRVLGVSLTDIAQQATGDAVSALDNFAQSIASGANAIDALGSTFAEFASNFLRQIAQMIQQQIIFNLISGLLRSIGSIGFPSGGGGGFGGGIGGGQFHKGGIVGAGGEARTVSPAWFSNAQRYHRGGIVGLKPDEVPAILQRGEEVLTAQDPRHRANGGGGDAGRPQVNIKVVNAIDGPDMVSKALGTRVGEKAILNFIRTNSSAVKSALG